MYKIGLNRALMTANKMFEKLIYDISLSEGNQMTLLETASTLSGKAPKNANSKDIIWVTNLKNGFDYILEKIKKNNFYFDKDTFCIVNRLVASNDNFDNLGGFRHHNIKITGAKHTGVDVPNLEISFFETVNKYYDDKRDGIKIVDLFLDLCKNQYFGDGNKRTAQLMMCGLLISDGYVPFSINFKDVEYSEALVNFYDDENKRDIILKKLLNEQKEATKSFLDKDELKIFREKEIQNFIEEIGTEKANELIVNKISQCQNSSIEVTREFLNSIKEGLEIQELLVENNRNEIYTEDFYEIVDCFLKSKNTKDMKAVFNYLKKIDFPIDYIDHFEEKFKEEINKTKKIDKPKEKNKLKINNTKEDEIIDDINKKLNDEKEI